MSNRRGMLYVSGTFVFAIPPVFWFVANVNPTVTSAAPAPVVQVADQAALANVALGELARRDPMSLVRLGQERYQREIDDYRCVFIKQERLRGKLSKVQKIEVRFRKSPASVYMLWQENAAGARRALFVDDREFTNEKGQKLARIEPAGAIARLFVKDIMLPVDGPDARKASRRRIDEFGFRSTLDLLERYNALAEQRGVLDLRYGGTGMVDGRPTFVIVRDLPFEEAPDVYPDARMILHLDQEWLLPVAVYSYADHDQQELLGSYVYTLVDLNPRFDEQAFEF